MTETLTDEQIVAKAVEADPDLFGHIVQRWERKIYALCYGMLGNAEEAKDAAQETFISAFKAIDNFRGEAKVSSWLHRIAVNQCLTRKRRQKVRPESSLDDEANENFEAAAPGTASPLHATEANERNRLVRAALSSLPSEMRQVILMKEFEEMTFQEISDALEIPLSTVKSRLYTGLKQLKLKLERTPLRVS